MALALRDLAAMPDAYVDAVRAVRPAGPFLLGGAS
jgi:thioesterase domain-containing protein